jgi:hypothetical protein
MSLTTILVSLALGMAFGSIIQRVQASSPDRVLSTLMLKDLTILKFMVLAVGVGAMGIGVLTALGLAHLKIKTLALLGVAIGGVIFGVGFAVGGYCPGTCLVGASEGRRDALFSIAGGLLGALVYALVFPWSQQVLLSKLDLGEATISTATGLNPGLAGILFGVVMIVVSLALPLRPGAGKAPQAAVTLGEQEQQAA